MRGFGLWTVWTRADSAGNGARTGPVSILRKQKGTGAFAPARYPPRFFSWTHSLARGPLVLHCLYCWRTSKQRNGTECTAPRGVVKSPFLVTQLSLFWTGLGPQVAYTT